MWLEYLLFFKSVLSKLLLPYLFFILQSIVCSIQFNTTAYCLLKTANLPIVLLTFLINTRLSYPIIGLPFSQEFGTYDYVCIFAVRFANPDRDREAKKQIENDDVTQEGNSRCTAWDSERYRTYQPCASPWRAYHLA